MSFKKKLEFNFFGAECQTFWVLQNNAKNPKKRISEKLKSLKFHSRLDSTVHSHFPFKIDMMDFSEQNFFLIILTLHLSSEKKDLVSELGDLSIVPFQKRSPEGYSFFKILFPNLSSLSKLTSTHITQQQI